MNQPVLARILSEIERLPQGVRAHIEQVRRTSVELAARFALDEARAELAALAHDICRSLSGPELLATARSLGIPVTPIDEAFPVFLHGPVGAGVLRLRYGLDDEEVLDAIRCHTMGREGMTPLDKVLFLADKLDPSKIGRYAFIVKVERLAREDLDRALLAFIDHQVRAFIEGGDLVHPAMIGTRNAALLALRGEPS